MSYFPTKKLNYLNRKKATYLSFYSTSSILHVLGWRLINIENLEADYCLNVSIVRHLATADTIISHLSLLTYEKNILDCVSVKIN